MRHILRFAEAFDCVDHQILLNKLELCVVRGNVLRLLRSYLTNKFQCILNSNQQIFSNLLSVSVGVPRDNVLGPFLFLVYITVFPNLCNSQMILYADDSAIICTRNHVQNLNNKSKK